MAQTGTMALRIPVPQPLMRRAATLQYIVGKNFRGRLTEYHPYMVLSRALKSGTEDSPGSTEADGLDTTVPITEGASNETTNERPKIVNRDLID